MTVMITDNVESIKQSNDYVYPLNCSGVEQLHLKVFSAIQV